MGHHCWDSPRQVQCVEAPPCQWQGGVSAEAWSRGVTVAVDGQSRADYDRMVQTRFTHRPTDGEGLAKAYKEAAEKGLPVVMIVGSWEHNNSRGLIERALPAASNGQDAVYVYVDPEKATGNLAEFARRQTADGHNATVTVVTTVRPDASGQPVPEDYIYRWQGADPSMIPSFRDAVAQAQTKQNGYRGQFRLEPPAPPAPPPVPVAPPPTDITPPAQPSAEALRLRQVEEDLRRLTERNQELERQLAAGRGTGAGAGAGAGDSTNPYRPGAPAPPEGFGSSRGTSGTGWSDAAKIIGGFGVGVLGKWVFDRLRGGSGAGPAEGGTTALAPRPESPTGPDGAPLERVPERQLTAEEAARLEELKGKLGMAANATRDQVRDRMAEGVLHEARVALRMDANTSPQQVLDAIKSTDGAARLRHELGLQPGATHDQIVEALGQRHLDNLARTPRPVLGPVRPAGEPGRVEPTGPRVEPTAPTGPRVEPLALPAGPTTPPRIEGPAPATPPRIEGPAAATPPRIEGPAAEVAAPAGPPSTEPRLFGGKLWRPSATAGDGIAIVQTIDRNSGQPNAPVIDREGPREGLDQSRLREVRVGNQTYLYEPNVQVVYQRGPDGQLQKLRLDSIRAVGPGSAAYTAIVGETTAGAPARTAADRPAAPAAPTGRATEAPPVVAAAPATRPVERPSVQLPPLVIRGEPAAAAPSTTGGANPGEVVAARPDAARVEGQPGRAGERPEVRTERPGPGKVGGILAPAGLALWLWDLAEKK